MDNEWPSELQAWQVLPPVKSWFYINMLSISCRCLFLPQVGLQTWGVSSKQHWIVRVVPIWNWMKLTSRSSKEQFKMRIQFLKWGYQCIYMWLFWEQSALLNPETVDTGLKESSEYPSRWFFFACIRVPQLCKDNEISINCLCPAFDTWATTMSGLCKVPQDFAAKKPQPQLSRTICRATGEIPLKHASCSRIEYK